MYRRILKTLYAVLSASSLSQLHCAHAQLESIQQVIWNEPDGNLSDLSQTFTAGQTLGVSWNAYNGTEYVDTTNNLVDLWVTCFNYNLDPFNLRLLENINLTQSGNFAWTILIPDSSLAISAKYVLRFKLPSNTFDTSTGELSSPGFLVLRAAASSTKSSSSISSTSRTYSASSTSPTVSTAPSSSPSPGEPAATPSSLSAGAKAGIGIGVTLIALSLICVGAFLLLRKRKNGVLPQLTAAQVSSQYESDKRPGQGSNAHAGTPSELPSEGRWGPSELPAG